MNSAPSVSNSHLVSAAPASPSASGAGPEAPWLRRTAIAVAALALLALLLSISRTPLPWADETMFASTSWSMARGGAPVPSVLQAFPGTGRWDWFYGPVAFHLSAAAFRVFGISPISGRILSWLGAILITVAGYWLVRLLHGNQTYAALCAALLAISPEIGARATSGRMDTFTVGLQLLSLATLITGRRASRAARWAWFILAGLLQAGAILSTPRSFPFAFALGLAAAVVMARFRDRWRSWLQAVAVMVAVVLACDFGWTWHTGLTPLRWLQYILRVTHKDAVDISPLIGGAWNFAWLHSPVWLILCAVILAAVGALLAHLQRRHELPPEILADLTFAAVLVSANLFLNLVLLARAGSYSIFFLLPLLPVVLAAASDAPLPLRRSALPRVLIVTGLLLMAGVMAGIRVLKTAELIASWNARDPAGMRRFAASHIPPGSTVFGPRENYFYAVEASGSRYLLPGEWTFPGLASGARVDSSELIAREARLHPTYLIWSADPLPDGLAPHLRLEAEWHPASPPSRWWKRINPYAGGYPATRLYRVVP